MNKRQEIVSTKGSRKRSRSTFELSTAMYGKVPPQAREMERAIVGAIMLEKGAFEIVSDILKPECFYEESNQHVFEAFMSLNRKGHPIDMMTVIQELMTMEMLEVVGGIPAIAKLTKDVTSSANIETHCRIVLQKFIMREMIRISGETIAAAYEDSSDCFDLLEKTNSSLDEISTNNIKSDYTRLGDDVPAYIIHLEALSTQDNSLTGVPSGFQELDKVTHGWQPSNLIILAARPAVGKTGFALNLARNAATHPVKPVAVGVFSLEMSSRQLLQRVFSNDSGIDMDRLSCGKYGESKVLYQVGGRLQAMPIFIDDSAGLTLFELRSKAGRMVRKHKVKMIIIDYLQLMSGEGKIGNREQEISTISRGLKKLAKDLMIPVIALSQLSREVEKRADKRPMLSDLRESGAIEQDADIVGALYRPSVEDCLKDAALFGTGTLGILKNRDGVLEDIAFKVSNNIQRWEEIGLMPKGNFRPLANDYLHPKAKEIEPF